MHLPYGFDVLVVDAIADRAAALAQESGARVARLPVFPFGCQTIQMAFPLSMNDSRSTLGKE